MTTTITTLLARLTSAWATAATQTDPAGLLPAREQMAVSLGWHILLASFGVAFPTIILVMHWRGVYRGDADALVLARRWSKVAAVLFAIGAVSGTVLSFEMGLLWPGLMGRFGDVLGLPFAFEGISFFLEAIFIGIYLYGWDRMPPRRHVLMLVPMAITGVVGTFCVLSVNAWMNNPTGFRIVGGKVVDVDPWAAMFNRGVWLQFAHMWLAAFMFTGFTVAAVYAAGRLRGRHDRRHRIGFLVPFAFASAAAIAQPFVGHVLGSGLEQRQPAKLAALELATTTESPSPLRLGGILVDGKPRFALDIPVLGSVLARNSLDAPVRGMDEFPASDRPPMTITHLSFQAMVGIGTLLATLAAAFWVLRRRGNDLLRRRWFLRAAVLAGPLAGLAIEFGWIATEVGRQPWTVYGVLRTTDAAGSNSGLWWLFAVTLLLYSAMTWAAVVVLRSMARRWRTGTEALPSPYGPDAVGRAQPGASQ